jgi:hypothetical protein
MTLYDWLSYYHKRIEYLTSTSTKPIRGNNYSYADMEWSWDNKNEQDDNDDNDEEKKSKRHRDPRRKSWYIYKTMPRTPTVLSNHIHIIIR